MKGLNPQPFLKWAGGKSRLLAQFLPFLPTTFERYAEPFVGSAAVFWQLAGWRAVGQAHFSGACLTDSNIELINSYQIVRDAVDDLITALTDHRSHHSPEHYYQVRAWRVGDLASVARAARFIYLNKTCFNGLYRVNRAGQFNVPLGRYVHPRIFDADQLRRASQILQSVELRVADFREVLNWARAGDFIYCDPPYMPVSKTANFTSYTAQPFGDAEQQALADLARELDRRGCQVMVSNAWLPATLELYRGFHCVELKAARAINANPERRGKVSELLALNYTPV